ncbi:MAG: aminoacyl--tRNA ligase-related protein [Candidatus Levybacteria bacterium]|nr:aminoacyl--tRNA ligase-related protein [Candidatus Levybacteria bacterium]
MRYSKLFGKTIKDAPKDEVAVNAKLLLRGGFIDKLMAGSYTLLHLGRRVEQKIEKIIREEMNATGAQEILMPLLHPKDIWNETGRWDSAKEVMYQFKKNDKEYALSFTHEEIVMDLLRKHISSYKDLPSKIYHFSTKFRDEKRAKSGILRGREFLMKDLYSAHVSEKDMMKYYDEIKKAYGKAFRRMGLDAILTEASGGVFTKNFTHEFQVIVGSGEDEIIYCTKGDFSANAEISSVKEGAACNSGHGPLKKAKAIEVGNIFPLGTYYSEKMGVNFTDKDGKKQPVWLASYGIGLTRAVGAIVEVHHDEKGIIWPKEVAPYDAHLIMINDEGLMIKEKADKIYEELQKAGVEVLYDDREDVSAGAKFADADLIGIPVRLVISKRTHSASSGQAGNKIEFKERKSEKSELLELEVVAKKIKV